MGGDKKDSGRPTAADPKVKPPSYRLKQSTVEDIDKIAEKLGKPRSHIMQTIIESGINIIKLSA